MTGPAVETPALEASGVSHRYGRRGAWALDAVDLEVPQGSIVALVGPNGAGKSTLMRAWLGFERPRRGSLRVLGSDLSHQRREAVSQVGYLAQSDSLHPGLSADDHIDLARTLHRGFDTEIARATLAELGTPVGRGVGKLSGGQRKHVELAIALGTRAPVLILDEPLVSLDAVARNEFLRVLSREIRVSGRTALLSSHIVRDIEQVCDRLIVLSAGRVRLTGTVADALASHRIATGTVPGAVGTIRRLDDRTESLVRCDDPALPSPDLEDLVLGYLVEDAQVAA
jgi:ABC-2 type transport system ATP-binding protein